MSLRRGQPGERHRPQLSRLRAAEDLEQVLLDGDADGLERQVVPGGQPRHGSRDVGSWRAVGGDGHNGIWNSAPRASSGCVGKGRSAAKRPAAGEKRWERSARRRERSARLPVPKGCSISIPMLSTLSMMNETTAQTAMLAHLHSQAPGASKRVAHGRSGSGGAHPLMRSSAVGSGCSISPL